MVYKFAAPLMFYGVVGSLTVMRLTELPGSLQRWVLYLGVMVLATVFFVRMLWSMADEVQDEHESLVIRTGDRRERIRLADVVAVKVSTVALAPAIDLIVRQNGGGSRTITFVSRDPCPLTALNTNPVATELRARIAKR